MKNVDNFDLLAGLMEYKDVEDEFYFLQIFQRRKENPDLAINNKLIDNFFLYQGDLEKKKDRIKELCEKMNARAYLRMNRRSARQVAIRCMVKTAEMIEQGNYKHIKRAYEASCGTCHCEKPRRWIIDLDPDTIDRKPAVIYNIENIGGKILVEIPTPNGVHLLTTPFDRMKASLGSIDVHNDNPTLLYYKVQ